MNIDPQKWKEDLVWDEYKYRHDLVWRHLIRSTIAVIGSISLLFSSDSNFNIEVFGIPFYLILSVAIIVYIGFTGYIMSRELILLSKIRIIHRKIQNSHANIHDEAKIEKQYYIKNSAIKIRFWKICFNIRVFFYISILTSIAIGIFIYLLYGVDCSGDPQAFHYLPEGWR